MDWYRIKIIQWPDLSKIDWEGCAKRDVPEKDPHKLLNVILVSGPFERLHDLLIQPEFWREHIKPHVKRVVDAAHELGIYFDMHSCGKIDRIVDDIIEMGVDMLDPLQPVNDLELLTKKHSRKVVFMGALDAQHVVDLPTSTDEMLVRPYTF